MKQSQYTPIKTTDQVVIFYALTKGYMDDIAIGNIKRFETGLIEYTANKAKTFYKEIEQTKMWTDNGEDELKKAISEFKDSFANSNK